MTSPETLPADIAALQTALTAERAARQQAEARASGAEAMVAYLKLLIAPVGDGAECPAVPAIEIEFAGKARVRVPASIPTGLAAAVVKALSGR